PGLISKQPKSRGRVTGWESTDVVRRCERLSPLCTASPPIASFAIEPWLAGKDTKSCLVLLRAEVVIAATSRTLPPQRWKRSQGNSGRQRPNLTSRRALDT